MARSKFSYADDDDVQKGDVRIRNGGGSRSRAKLIWWSSTHIFLALLAIILLAAYLGRKNGGFAWESEENKAGTINYHALFATLGFMGFSGIGSILYRLMPNTGKLAVKFLHAGFHLTGFCFIVASLCAAFYYHENVGAKNLASTHSWMGLLTLILMSFQWTIGFLGFLLPGFKQPIRIAYLPIHVFAGIATLIMSLATILVGIEKFHGGTTLNVLGLVVVCYGFTGCYILVNRNFARPADKSPDMTSPEGFAFVERRASIHSSKGNYQAFGDDPSLREAFGSSKDLLNRFQERLESRKQSQNPEAIITTTTVTE